MEKPAPFRPAREFVPARGLRNGHLQTLATLWPRRFPGLPEAEPRLVEVESGTQLRLDCHWQPERSTRPTLILLHGLEGSSGSQYMVGTAQKAWRAGFNAIRMNFRNCGGTEHLTPSLYDAGLSGDLRRVAEHLLEREALPELHLGGYSMGGNIVLKLAGEWGAEAPKEIRSVSVVSPSIDLALCADALNHPRNRLYQWHFLRGLKARLRRKARLYPQVYETDGLARVRTVREFDDAFTARYCSYGDADNYYTRASALRCVQDIALPTLILATPSDPFVPIESFRNPSLTGNPNITLLTPRQGGHAGFIGRRTGGEDRFWAENRIVEFASRLSSLLSR
ncbi:MAG: YheT family hydrolase [Terriglobia bacterium]